MDNIDFKVDIDQINNAIKGMELAKFRNYVLSQNVSEDFVEQFIELWNQYLEVNV